jgi:type I restriction enzyme S subunit
VTAAALLELASAKAWPKVQLRDVLEVQNGFAFSSKKFSEKGGVPLIRIRDLKDNGASAVGFLGDYDVAYVVNDGDLLIGMDGAFRCYEWRGGPALLNQRVCRLVNFDSQLHPRFLFYGINKYLKEIEDETSFTTVKHLSSKTVKAIEFPLPPLEEQKRIVAVLDQAFAALDRARALAEANLSDAEALFENTLEAVFERFASSDLILPLGEAVHADCKLSYGIVQPGDEVASGLPIVRPVDLGRPIISTAGLKRILPDRADGYSRTKLTGAELLLCVRGTTGEVSMASPELAGANVTRGIVPVRFDPAKVDLEFAYFQMRSPFMRKQIAANTYGAALMQINIKDVRELKFVRPSLEIQQKAKTEMRHLFDRAERMIGHYQAKLDDLAALRETLLQQAFAGELT